MGKHKEDESGNGKDEGYSEFMRDFLWASIVQVLIVGVSVGIDVIATTLLSNATNLTKISCLIFQYTFSIFTHFAVIYLLLKKNFDKIIEIKEWLEEISFKKEKNKITDSSMEDSIEPEKRNQQTTNKNMGETE